MHFKNQLTKTPYLVLFIVLISIGVGTASALITITLAGDVVITGFLDMTGDKITGVGTPTANTDAATKGYVDQSPTTDTLAVLGCTTDQIAVYDGNNWVCIDDTKKVEVIWQLLSSCNLNNGDLSGLDLSGVDLSGCDLSGANLSGADLSGANLGKAIDDTNAILLNTDLTGTTLGSFYVLTSFFTSEFNEEWSTFAECNSGDTSIDVLETDGTFSNGWHANILGHIEGFSTTEPTVFTILCEDT